MHIHLAWTCVTVPWSCALGSNEREVHMQKTDVLGQCGLLNENPENTKICPNKQHQLCIQGPSLGASKRKTHRRLWRSVCLEWRSASRAFAIFAFWNVSTALSRLHIAIFRGNHRNTLKHLRPHAARAAARKVGTRRPFSGRCLEGD